MKRASTLLAAAAMVFAAAVLAWPQAGESLTPVISKPASSTRELPAELSPFLSVSLHGKVPAFVQRVLVDRGSTVKEGELLVELAAPEMQAQTAEMEFKIQAIAADQAQAEAQLAAAESVYGRLKKASETPGAVAGNEVVQAEKQVEAAKAVVESRQRAGRAAEAALKAQKDLETYLRITAPFNGVVTERSVHPGALVGPGNDLPLLTVQQLSHLRMVVAVPEADVGGIVAGAKVDFHVPAYPERTYSGTVARISGALDAKSRTMPVELDVFNRDGSLAPGMYPSVQWPVRSSRDALFVPKTSVVTTTERLFVIRSRDGRAEWVDVNTGAADGTLIEVTGKLRPGDLVVRSATDEIREGDPLRSAK